jgi:integrase
MTARKSYRLREGLKSLVIYQVRQGWRFDKTVDGKREYVTRKKKAKIEELARDYLRADGEGPSWDGVTRARQEFLMRVNALVPEDGESDVLRYLERRNQSVTIESAVARFMLSMSSKGRSSRHVDALKMDLDVFAESVQGNVADCTVEMLSEWCELRAGTAGPSRRKMIRATLVQFFRWCRREGYVSAESVTAADRLPSISVPAGSLAVMTREQFESCLQFLPACHLPWFLLNAWAGLRPEEAAPSATKLRDGKRGVSWEDIDFDFNIIRISRETSKVKRPRIVPLHPCLREALWPLRSTGAICGASPVHDKTLAMLGKKVFGGSWPKDCLRHSYGSYRNAIVRNLPQVAEEMGTSVEMLHRHYHNPRPAEEGENWFQPLGKVMQKLCKLS